MVVAWAVFFMVLVLSSVLQRLCVCRACETALAYSGNFGVVVSTRDLWTGPKAVVQVGSAPPGLEMLLFIKELQKKL